MYLSNIFSGRRCQFVINAYCILASVLLVYLICICGQRRQEHTFSSNAFLFSQSSSHHVTEDSNDLYISGEVTLYKSDVKDCKIRAKLKTQPNVSLSICTYDPSSDLEISATIHRSGEWDPPSIQIVKYAFRQDIRFNDTLAKDIKRSRLVFPTGDRSVDNVRETENRLVLQSLSLLDLGCNIGAFTLTMASMGYQVLAVDAMEESLQLLATSLRMNNLSSLVTLVNNAISDRREQVYLEVNIKNRGGSFINQKHRNTNISTLSQSRKSVSSICLDDLIPYVRTGRVFLKMDIEGFEAKAFQCAAKFFNAVDVQCIYMEWVFHRRNLNGVHIIDFLTKREFMPYQHPQSEKSLEPISYASWPDNVFWIKQMK